MRVDVRVVKDLFRVLQRVLRNRDQGRKGSHQLRSPHSSRVNGARDGSRLQNFGHSNLGENVERERKCEKKPIRAFLGVTHYLGEFIFNCSKTNQLLFEVPEFAQPLFFRKCPLEN